VTQPSGLARFVPTRKEDGEVDPGGGEMMNVTFVELRDRPSRIVLCHLSRLAEPHHRSCTVGDDSLLVALEVVARSTRRQICDRCETFVDQAPGSVPVPQTSGDPCRLRTELYVRRRVAGRET